METPAIEKNLKGSIEMNVNPFISNSRNINPLRAHSIRAHDYVDTRGKMVNTNLWKIGRGHLPTAHIENDTSFESIKNYGLVDQVGEYGRFITAKLAYSC